jgi:hypothetical protein
MKAGLGERLIDAALIGTERAAPLQEQGDALELGPLLMWWTAPAPGDESP